jgi:hypothetical protein
VARTERKAFLDRASSQPAVISGAVLLFSLFCASVFLFAYVRIFDWRLIWLVDYTDILRIGLVAVAFFSGVAWYLWAVFDDASGFAERKTERSHWRRYLIRGLWVGLIAYWLYVEYASGEARYTLVGFGALSILMILVVAWRAFKLSKQSPIKIRDAILLVFLVIVSVGILGSSFGYYARDAWRSIEQQVDIEGSVLKGARLIMMTARHAVFYVDGTTLVVPASAVRKIQSRKN